jgi:type I restriction enzyme S subunit
VDVRGWVPGLDDAVAEDALAALSGGNEIATDGEEDDGSG